MADTASLNEFAEEILEDLRYLASASVALRTRLSVISDSATEHENVFDGEIIVGDETLSLSAFLQRLKLEDRSLSFRMLERFVSPLLVLDRRSDEVVVSAWLSSFEDALDLLVKKAVYQQQLSDAAEKVLASVQGEQADAESQTGVIQSGNTLKKAGTGRLRDYSPKNPYHIIDDYKTCLERHKDTSYTILCKLLFMIELFDRLTSAVGKLIKLVEIKG